MFSSLLIPVSGSIWSRSMHTPTTTIRALPGADDMIDSITPGTPTHSKITAGLTAGPGIHGGNIGAFDGSLYAAICRQLSYGDFTFGSTTRSAPIRCASAR